MTVAVLGRGLLGAAAARHLAKSGQDVLLIGPGEPEDKVAHRGVFGSHYDEGRITRRNALRSFWVEVADAAISRYAEIEAESGISFFTETGAMMAGGPAWMRRVEAACAGLEVNARALDAEGLAETFPFFRFPDTYTGVYEPKEAGHVSPRRLVAAQTEAARRHGARIVEQIVTGFKERPDHVQVVTERDTFRVDEVIVATGCMTDMVLGRPDPGLSVYARTVTFFEVSEAEANRLQTMPSLVYEAPQDPYLLPPIRYPDGKIYVKLGGDPSDDILRGEAEIGAWFRGGGSPVTRDLHVEMISDLMPGLEVQSVSMSSCVTSWTEDRLPEIARLSDRVTVCTGGNGAGAKCSDELGRRCAQLVLEQQGEAA